jgi:hypothetical protein
MINAALTSDGAVFLIFSWSAIDRLQHYTRSMLTNLPPDPLIHLRYMPHLIS